MSKPAPIGQTNSLLGYPMDARLLIINADDLGMCHAVNAGIFHALKEGVVHSTTLMTPCPWALHAIHWLQENPDIPFGVHLTLICEAVNYKWGSLAPAEKVPSLLDETGYFYSLDRSEEFLAVAKLDEVEIEFRQQIERVLSANLKPTHLDWHCLHSGGRADIFDMTLGLAREYGLAVRVGDPAGIQQVQNSGLPTTDYDLLDSFRLNPIGKSDQYAQMLRELPAGLTEWAVHPAIESAELLALEPTGNHVRQTDYDFLISPQARQIIDQEGIILLNYKPIQTVWQNKNMP